MKRTKIVATIGPACDTPEMLSKLSESGVDVFRFNFSHGTHEWHGERIDLIRKLKLPGGVMLDTKGPEIRTGEFKKPLKLKVGDRFVFTTEKGVYDDTGKVSVSYDAFTKDVRKGGVIIIDSGLIEVIVREIKDNDVECEVIKGEGEITTKRHINLAGEHTSLPTITEQDYKDIEFGLQHKVDFIALSFVRSGKDILEVKKFCQEKAGYVPFIIAKIECKEAIQNLHPIIIESDGIMVARGDLACEVGFEKVPCYQKEIMHYCKLHAKPVIVATQMLSSMLTKVTPTRAEVSDVANAVFEGASAVMTSEETTASNDPINVIKAMNSIVSISEKHSKLRYNFPEIKNIEMTLIQSAIRDYKANSSLNSIIVVITGSGRLASIVANERADFPVYAFTNDEKLTNSMSLLYGVYSKTIEFEKEHEKTVKKVFEMIKNSKEYKENNYRECLLIYRTEINGIKYPSITLRELL